MGVGTRVVPCTICGQPTNLTPTPSRKPYCSACRAYYFPTNAELYFSPFNMSRPAPLLFALVGGYVGWLLTLVLAPFCAWGWLAGCAVVVTIGVRALQAARLEARLAERYGAMIVEEARQRAAATPAGPGSVSEAGEAAGGAVSLAGGGELAEGGLAEDAP